MSSGQLRSTLLSPGHLMLLVSLVAVSGCAAGQESEGSGGGGGEGDVGAGSGDVASSIAAQGAGGAVATSASVGASSGSGGGPMGTYGPKDDPPFKSGAELCAYVNEERGSYAGHDRFRGPPWSGEYHQMVTWPLALTVDPALMNEAQAKAGALAAGAAPEGAPFSDGAPPPHQYLYVAGVSSSAYLVASEEAAGDWTTDLAGNLHAGITSNNGTARMALFYQDPGGQGPVLSRIGCGGAATPAGARWWVVMMAP